MSRSVASQAAKISNIRVTVLIKTVHDEFNSVTYVVRNMANDTFDQKFGNHNKNHFQNATIVKFWSGISACSQSGRLLP